MITKSEFEAALKQKDEAQSVIVQYNKEQQDAFDARLKDNPIFTDDELRYSAVSLCPCGHGLAYPIACGPFHYWDCSAILKGVADKSVTHCRQLSFSFYDVKSESEQRGTTRGVFRPKVQSAG